MVLQYKPHTYDAVDTLIGHFMQQGWILVQNAE